MRLLLITILSLFNTVLIPVQFSDEGFSYSEEELSSYVSHIEEYFDAQFGAQDSFKINITDSVRLSGDVAYYGSNKVFQKDFLFYEAVIEACNKVNSKVDFRDMDNNDDGKVDLVLFLAAGKGEDETGVEEMIWPHSDLLSSAKASLSLDGVAIDRYAVCCIENIEGEFAGIGKICHEIGHGLGLQDLYDSDGERSGGLTDALPKGLALMNDGFNNNSGMTPPNLCAIEKEVAGIGDISELSAGEYTLKPSDKILKVTGDDSGEYYLIECRAKQGWDRYIEEAGLAVYHIDRTGYPAGWSDFLGREVKACERWTGNEVNCNPEWPCAHIVNASENESLFGNGTGFFDGFVFRNSTQLALCLRKIRINAGGSISFSAMEPVEIVSLDVFQDGAAVKFRIDPSLGEPTHCSVEWMSGDEIIAGLTPEKRGEIYCANLSSGLVPSSDYSVRINIRTTEAEEFNYQNSFKTRYYREEGIPFIYLNTAERNSDGSLVAGSLFPLKIFNIPDSERVTWFFNGVELRGGWFRAASDGTLSAEVRRKDGSVELLYKKITVK